jgi:hypothetical protein
MGGIIMVFYYLPLQENRMNFSGKRHPTFEKYIVKNDIGILVLYDEEGDFNENAIRINNYGVHDTWTIIEAESVTEAIKIFYSSYEGASIGGNKLKSKALQIDRGRRIVKIPYCNLMKKDGDSRFFCGPDGLFGMCVLGGVSDLPDGECAMRKFCHISAFNFSKKLPKGYTLRKIIVDNIVYGFADTEALC